MFNQACLAVSYTDFQCNDTLFYNDAKVYKLTRAPLGSYLQKALYKLPESLNELMNTSQILPLIIEDAVNLYCFPIN